MSEATIRLPLEADSDGALRFSLGREVRATLTLADGSTREGWVSSAWVHHGEDGAPTGEASVGVTVPYRIAAADATPTPAQAGGAAAGNATGLAVAACEAASLLRDVAGWVEVHEETCGLDPQVQRMIATAEHVRQESAKLDRLAEPFLVEAAPPAATSPTPAPLTLRPEVAAFALAMEAQLRKHDATRGKRGWQNDDPHRLLDRLKQETAELRAVLLLGVSPNRPEAALAEAADIGNFAMMIADVEGGLALATPTPAPTAPRTDEDHARYLHEADAARDGVPPRWDALTDAEREPYRERVRACGIEAPAAPVQSCPTCGSPLPCAKAACTVARIQPVWGLHADEPAPTEAPASTPDTEVPQDLSDIIATVIHGFRAERAREGCDPFRWEDTEDLADIVDGITHRVCRAAIAPFAAGGAARG